MQPCAGSAAGRGTGSHQLCQNETCIGPLACRQAQWLDEGRLLLALGPPDASALRHVESQQQAAFLAVFSLEAARLVAVLPNSSPVRPATLSTNFVHRLWLRRLKAGDSWAQGSVVCTHPRGSGSFFSREAAAP